MVVPTFIEKALNYKDIIVHGDGEQTRCFCDVSEAVVAMYQLIINEACYGEIFNVGNPYNSISMLELAEMIKKLNNDMETILKKCISNW
jgi:nucleoside-diphosphate-sugar epimerase